jgi:small subunit ribosomal protein S20
MAENKRIKDRSPEERLTWRRALLKRKNERKRERNRLVKARIASLKRSLRKSLTAGDDAAGSETLKSLYKTLDKAAKSGVIHKKTATRRKSRAAKQLARKAE